MTQYLILCNNGEYVHTKCIPYDTITTLNRSDARHFSGKRARRWIKRHPDLNAIMIPR